VAWLPCVDEADPHHGLQESEMPHHERQVGEKYCKLRKTFHRSAFESLYLILVANISHSLKDKEKERMEMEADRRWKVGTRYIRMEDLMLVSLHHISKGSWQPQLRLRTSWNEIQQRRAQPIPPLGA
jgi:hypothetical protein